MKEGRQLTIGLLQHSDTPFWRKTNCSAWLSELFFKAGKVNESQRYIQSHNHWIRRLFIITEPNNAKVLAAYLIKTEPNQLWCPAATLPLVATAAARRGGPHTKHHLLMIHFRSPREPSSFRPLPDITTSSITSVSFVLDVAGVADVPSPRRIFITALGLCQRQIRRDYTLSHRTHPLCVIHRARSSQIHRASVCV